MTKRDESRARLDKDWKERCRLLRRADELYAKAKKLARKTDAIRHAAEVASRVAWKGWDEAVHKEVGEEGEIKWVIDPSTDGYDRRWKCILPNGMVFEPLTAEELES